MKYLVFVLMMIISTSSFALTFEEIVQKTNATDGMQVIKNTPAIPSKDKWYYLSGVLVKMNKLDSGNYSAAFVVNINYDMNNMDDLKVMMTPNSRFSRTNVKEQKHFWAVLDKDDKFEGEPLSNLSMQKEYTIIGLHAANEEFDGVSHNVPIFIVAYIKESGSQPGTYERAIEDGAKGIINIFKGAENARNVLGGQR